MPRILTPRVSLGTVQKRGRPLLVFVDSVGMAIRGEIQPYVVLKKRLETGERQRESFR